MSVQLYDGCFGITRGGEGVASESHGPMRSEAHTDGLFFGCPGFVANAWAGVWLEDGTADFFCSNPPFDQTVFDIISVHATREEAEAELRRMQGDAPSAKPGLFNSLSPEQQAEALAFDGNPDFGPADPVRLDPSEAERQRMRWQAALAAFPEAVADYGEPTMGNNSKQRRNHGNPVLPYSAQAVGTREEIIARQAFRYADALLAALEASHAE